MGTWTLKCAFLALLIQVAVSFPSFGNGAQQEEWNEVDDEHPGEILPADYMMPMRDPNGNSGDTITEVPTSKPSDKSPTSPPTSNADDSLPKPEPEKLTTAKPQTKTAPVNIEDKTTTIEKADDSSSKQQERRPKPLLVLTIRKLPTHDETKIAEQPTSPKTENGLTSPVPDRSTSHPQTTTTPVNPDDEAVPNEKTADSSSKSEKEDQKPIFVLKITALPTHQELPAPSPTPRPPTVNEEVDCDCEECEEAIEKQKSDNGNAEEMDCQEPDTEPPHIESRGKIEITRSTKIAEHSPLSLLGTGKEDDNLEEIFRDVAKVISRMPVSEKKQLIQSIPFSRVQEEKMGLQNEKGIPKIIAGIMMKVSDASTNEDDGPCMEERSDEEPPVKNRLPTIDVSSINGDNRAPLIKGLLLKTLIPRQTLAAKDIYEIMRRNHQNDEEKRMITSLNDVLKRGTYKPSRFVALQDEGYTSRLPPLHFPMEVARPFTRDSRVSDIPPIFRPSDNEFVSRFINSLKPSKVSPLNQSPYNSFNSLGEYNDHLRRFDPELKGLMDIVLKQMANHEASNVRKIGVPVPISVLRNLE